MPLPEIATNLRKEGDAESGSASTGIRTRVRILSGKLNTFRKSIRAFESLNQTRKPDCCKTRPCDSGHRHFCPEYEEPERRDFLSPLAGRGPGQGRDQLVRPKNQKLRIVPINSEVRRILALWNLGRKNEYVFSNQKTGERFVELDSGLELACRKAGIEGVAWHTLRHRFASCLLEPGADIIAVKELLGHSTVTVTMRHTRANLASKVEALGQLSSAAANLLHVAPKCSNRHRKVTQIRR